LQEGLLCRRFERPHGICHHMQLLMPRSLRPSFLKMVHGQSTSHFGYEKNLKQVQRRAYWDSWKTGVKLFCACCKLCIEFHRETTAVYQVDPFSFGAASRSVVYPIQLQGASCSDHADSLQCKLPSHFVVLIPRHVYTTINYQ